MCCGVVGPFPRIAHRRPGLLAAKADDFGSTQAGLHGHQQKRPVTASDPAAEVGSGELGGHVDAGEEGDRPANITLARDGEHTLRQCLIRDNPAPGNRPRPSWSSLVGSHNDTRANAAETVRRHSIF